MKIILMSLLMGAITACSSGLVSNSYSEFQSNQFKDESLTDIEDQEFNITVLNVGQGDATLVQGQNGKVVLIDGGAIDPHGAPIIRNFLESENIAHLDVAILTHFDGDHMGAFVSTYQSDALIWTESCGRTTWFPKEALIDLGVTDKETDSALFYESCSRKNSLGHLRGKDSILGYQIDLGDGFVLKIIAADGYVLGEEERVSLTNTENERSIVTLVTGPDGFAFLNMADAPGEVYGAEDSALEHFVANYLEQNQIKISVLKVGHHGSLTSSSHEFLERIDPDISIISVGPNNYGHVSCEVYERLFQWSNEVWQTGLGQIEKDCAWNPFLEIVGDHIDLELII